MKFRRNVHLYRGALDATPLATVFFLLVIFVMLGARINTPGVHIQLASGTQLSGTDKRKVSVWLDANGRLFFENQLIEPAALKARLMAAVAAAAEPPVLIIHADKSVTEENLAALEELAGAAGIREAIKSRVPVSGQATPKPSKR